MGVLHSTKAVKASRPKRAKFKPVRAYRRKSAAGPGVSMVMPSNAIQQGVIRATTADRRIEVAPVQVMPARRRHVGFGREREAYRKAKADLLRSAPGGYFVFVGDQVVGPFPSFRKAMQAGYRKFGLGPLYIKQAVEEDKVIDLGYSS